MPKGKIELLAPAGDFASLRAAVENGADSVYFGLQEFNMRNNAKNFSITDLKEIKKICGIKVKRYLTLNTIMYEDEAQKIEEIIKSVKGKVDAIICWDLLVVNLCKKYKIPFHISTQASVANSSAALLYKRLGAERIVLARELNLGQIKKISKIMDVEIFAHGAMCVAESGRCFTSQFLFNKSANRGECLQPCRRSYRVIDEDGNELSLDNNKVMSAKDLCTLPFIEEIKTSGVKAIKIEGRNRPAEYVRAVVKVYRKALDNKLSEKDVRSSLEELKKVYNRGFSSGFYLGKPTTDDFTKTEDGEATESKRFIGKVQKYWMKISAASIFINSGELKISDEIYLTGKDTGIKRIKLENMEVDHRKVKSVKKGQVVRIKLPECKKGDDIYLIVNRKLAGR